MRLHTLTLTSFGPFAGPESVDFERLNHAGLFLLSGPTGAGKTSILDGICFALYGTVPGARQSARSLRSDHALAAAAPTVVLELTVRGQRLRVTRSPSWERPKRRGAGTTTEQAKVLVERRDDRSGEWTTVSTRLDEAGGFLTEHLGLSAAQFCQVVLLPQGQFAEFLRADAERRRDLLETLFDTGRFGGVEAWLVDRRQQTGRALAAVDGELEQLAARVAQEISGGEHVDAADALEDLDRDRWPDRIAQEVQAAGGCVEEAAEQRDQAAALATTAANVFAEAERRVARAARVQALRARLADLDAAAADLAHQRAELAAARRVMPLAGLLAEVDRIDAELAAARSRISTARAGVVGVAGATSVLAATGTDAVGTDATSRSRADVVRRAVRSTRDEVAALRGVAPREAEVQALRAEVRSLEEEAYALAENRAAVSRWLAEAPAVRAELVRARATAQAAQTRLVRAEAHLERCRAWAAAAVRRDALADELTGLEDAVRNATDEHQKAREAEQHLRELRLAGMAAELARGLQPGEPCAVCGSREHPAPPPDASPVEPADESAARARASRAESARTEAERRAAAVRIALAEQRALTDGDQSVDDLDQRLRDAQRAVELEREQSSTLPQADQRLADFDQEREAHLRDQVSLDEQLHALQARAAERRHQAARLAADVAAARGEDASVADRVLRLTEAAGHLEEFAAALGRVEQLTDDRRALHQRLELTLAEHEFGTVDDVRKAARTPARIELLERTVEQHEVDRRSVEEQLADPALQAAEAEPHADVDRLRAAAEEADRARVAAASRHDRLARRHAALLELQRAIQETCERRTPVAEAHRVADPLARLTEGKSTDNALRMSLSAYVLAARLEQVAAAATERLLRMTSGRYALRHVATPATARARGGLTLRVLDAWTGQERDPGSLSGGESFAASLSLALGLADVVAAEAGGVVLETLFVDEGFGSLDDDTLDDVMSVLDGLREGGRAVGVVSHVADLRQRIPVQVRVSKAPSGSTIET